MTTLFDLGPEPSDRDTSAPCDHPAELQFLNRNLFTGSYDVVCQSCGATVAADYQDGAK